MSAPVDFEGSNFTYLGPDGTDICDLPVFRHERGVTMCWRFTPAEIVKIMQTGCVWVELMTHTVPPILVSSNELVQMTDPDGTQRPSKPEPFLPKARTGGLIGNAKDIIDGPA